MAVLAVASLPLIAGVLLSGGYVAGEQDALIYLAVLSVLHGAAGWTSWSCRATGWGDGLLWAVALTLHTVTYALNWELYTGLAGGYGEQLANANLLENLTVVAVILIPSILMYGGPFRAIIRPPEEVAQEVIAEGE